MKITTAWCDDGTGATPWLVGAYDENIYAEISSRPDRYIDAVADADGEVREVVIDLGDFDPRSVFADPVIEGRPVQ